MRFLIIYLLISMTLLTTLMVTGLIKFEFTTCEPSFKNGLITILYIIAIIFIWPIIVLIFTINGRKSGRK